MSLKNKNSMRSKVLADRDFIYCPRLGNSLESLMERNPEGLDDERICKVLLITQSELEDIYDSAIEKLRNFILKEQK